MCVYACMDLCACVGISHKWPVCSLQPPRHGRCFCLFSASTCKFVFVCFLHVVSRTNVPGVLSLIALDNTTMLLRGLYSTLFYFGVLLFICLVHLVLFTFVRGRAICGDSRGVRKKISDRLWIYARFRKSPYIRTAWAM